MDVFRNTSQGYMVGMCHKVLEVVYAADDI